MVLLRYYQRLAEQRDVDSLLWLALWDERVFHVVIAHNLVDDVVKQLPSPRAARFLARGSVGYEEIHECAFHHFVPITSFLARYQTATEGSALSDALSSIAVPERHRLDLFNFSESFRHLILSRNLFAQRGTVRALSYMFCDDYLADAVAVLQHKTDVLNHVNRIFVDTPDFVSWRFSVRAMSLAGGYNEDQLEVDKTERFAFFMTRVVPEFLAFFFVAFAYGMVRHWPKRAQLAGVPRWLRRHRAYWTGFVTACCGVVASTGLEWRVFRAREYYCYRREQERRRRRGAERRGLPYKPNTYFDDTDAVTRSIAWLQWQHYLVAATCLTVTCVPMRKMTFPAFMGDVAFRYPFVPRLFPSVIGMDAASRCLVPFVVVPFTVTMLSIQSLLHGASLYDFYVHARYRWWKAFRASE
mgnify:FL=1